MKKFIFILMIVFLCSASLSSWALVNKIVALVDGESITLYELQARVKHLLGMFEDEDVDIDDLPEEQLKQTQKQVLDQMVNDILLRQEAEKYGIEVTEKEIDRHIERVRSENNMSPEEFEDHLQSQGLTMEAYRQQISDSITRQSILNMMVRKKVLVTDEEIEKFYKNNSSAYKQGSKVHLKVILVPEVEQAGELREKISSGDIDFDEAAVQFSQGPNAQQGGDLGKVEWKKLAPQWQEAIEGLESGQLSRAFQVRDQGAIIKLVESKSDTVKPLSEVKDQIREKIFEEKLNQRFDDYIQGLREKAVIDIRL
ncbi:MAG: SurA N-terminal domain-containing protein [Desulfonatronovibrio sp.]